MRTIEEACSEVLQAFSPLGPERVPLLDALGRYTCAEFAARAPLPPFDNSAMDGYAVHAEDVARATPEAPVTLPVAGESRAGGAWPTPLAKHTALRIFTGAPMPADADAVVIQENTSAGDGVVQVREPVKPGANVRRKGSDLSASAPALAARTRIGPGEIALLASQDVASIEVFQKPRVAILSTGDELRDIGEPAREGSIVNSNAYALSAQVLEAGAEPWVFPSVPDDRARAAEAIRAALSADVVVLTGGVSVGDYDVVRDALADAGIALGFWKVQMKPGKPVAFARHGRVPVLGLPGNPASAFVGFELFVRPGLRAMLGDPRPERPRVSVRLTKALSRQPGRTELARARLRRDARGLVAEIGPKQGSGSLPSIVNIDALVVIPGELAEVGSDVSLSAILLRDLPG